MCRKDSQSLLLKTGSGRSLKYCFTMSATSKADWLSYETPSGSDSTSSRRYWIRDFTPDFRKRPTWEKTQHKWTLNTNVLLVVSKNRIRKTLSWHLFQSDLVQTLGPQVVQRSEDAGRKRLSGLLDADEQRNPEDPPTFHLRHLGLPRRFRNSPTGDRESLTLNNQTAPRKKSES